jgi:hypothetical protein
MLMSSFYYSTTWSNFTVLECPVLHLWKDPHFSPWQSLLLKLSIVLHCPECQQNRIIYCIAFSDLLLSRSNTHLRFIHVCVDKKLIHLKNICIVFHCMAIIVLLIHLARKGHISWFQFWVIMNHTAINICM